MAKIDKTPPEVFPSVVCAKLDAGTVTATCFNLINQDRQRLATLTTTDDGRTAGLTLFTPGNDRAADRADA